MRICEEMSLKRALLGIILIIMGVLGIFVGSVDDAPGASLIGFILILWSIYLTIRKKKSWVKSRK